MIKINNCCAVQKNLCLVDSNRRIREPSVSFPKPHSCGSFLFWVSERAKHSLLSEARGISRLSLEQVLRFFCALQTSREHHKEMISWTPLIRTRLIRIPHNIEFKTVSLRFAP